MKEQMLPRQRKQVKARVRVRAVEEIGQDPSRRLVRAMIERKVEALPNGKARVEAKRKARVRARAVEERRQEPIRGRAKARVMLERRVAALLKGKMRVEAKTRAKIQLMREKLLPV